MNSATIKLTDSTTEKIDRLVRAVDKRGEKLSKLLHQSSCIKVAIAIGVALTGIFVLVASQFIGTI